MKSFLYFVYFLPGKCCQVSAVTTWLMLVMSWLLVQNHSPYEEIIKLAGVLAVLTFGYAVTLSMISVRQIQTQWTNISAVTERTEDIITFILFNPISVVMILIFVLCFETIIALAVCKYKIEDFFGPKPAVH